MSGCPLTPIGDVCNMVGGGTPARSNTAYFEGSIPWATIRDMKSDWIEATEFSITEQAVKRSASNVLPAGTVVVASRVGLGKVCRVRLDTAINQDLRGFIPKDHAEIDQQYLFYWFKSIENKIVAAGTGATVQGVTLNFFRSLSIPLPPLEEQRRISKTLDIALSAIRNAVSNTKKNMVKARAIEKSYLSSVFNTEELAWPYRKLAEVSDIRNGYAFKSRDFSRDGATKVIKITNVGVEKFVEESSSFLPSHFSAEYKNFSVRSGNIVLALTRTIIAGGVKVAVVPDGYDGALLNQRVASIDANAEELNPSFLFAFLSSEFVAEYIAAHVNTLMQPNLSIADLRSMPIPVPTRTEQSAIGNNLGALTESARRLQDVYIRKLDALAMLQRSLLQMAFAGKLVLSNE